MYDRLWESLKRDITGLLLGWRGTVSLKVRDADNRLVLNFSTSTSDVPAGKNSRDTSKLRSPQFGLVLSVLTQANYITFDEWASWVPASASTSTVSIKGAISLDPAPSKLTQFISLGIRPLSPEFGHNELFDEVNRLFARSSFGNMEDDTGLDEVENSRRQVDKRFKHDGYTNRQLKGRKDVDRHPMFHLRIAANPNYHYGKLDDGFIDETSLHAVLDVLRAMITQWLSVHHFRPQKLHKNRNRPDTASSVQSISTNTQTVRNANSPSISISQSQAREGPGANSSTTASRRRKRPATSLPESSRQPQNRVFADWSRIKSAKPEFFSRLASPKNSTGRGSQSLEHLQAVSSNAALSSDPEEFVRFEPQAVPQGAFSASALVDETSKPVNNIDLTSNVLDETILWTDPISRATHLLNSRTGCVVRDASPGSLPKVPVHQPGHAQQDSNKSVRIVPRLKTTEDEKGLWLDDVLRSWDNPIFKISEQPIQQISIDEETRNHVRNHHAQHCCHPNLEKNLTDVAVTTSNRLSKDGLRRAEIIAQVDKKFILVKMRDSCDSAPSPDVTPELLVLIDQHAADERIQVEALLEELCSPASLSRATTEYQSKLGHKSPVSSTLLEKPISFTMSVQERALFVTHAARLAAWGILYDISSPFSSGSFSPSSGVLHPIVSVTHLPPTVYARCKADTHLLVSLLRSTIWKYAEATHLPPLPAQPIPITDSEGPSWPRRLATCPEGLVELINSRACRSAIMFNDVLSRSECEDLVSRLSGCVFPFMCAHGRPSMVPLGGLGGLSLGHGRGGDGSLREELEGGSKQGGSCFVQKWKVWRAGEEREGMRRASRAGEG